MILYAIKRYIQKGGWKGAKAVITLEESWYCGVSARLWVPEVQTYSRTLLPRSHAKAVIRALREDTGLAGVSPWDPRYVLVKVRA